MRLAKNPETWGVALSFLVIIITGVFWIAKLEVKAEGTWDEVGALKDELKEHEKDIREQLRETQEKMSEQNARLSSIDAKLSIIVEAIKEHKDLQHENHSRIRR